MYSPLNCWYINLIIPISLSFITCRLWYISDVSANIQQVTVTKQIKQGRKKRLYKDYISSLKLLYLLKEIFLVILVMSKRQGAIRKAIINCSAQILNYSLVGFYLVLPMTITQQCVLEFITKKAAGITRVWFQITTTK